MVVGYLLSFFGGIIADIARKIFLPHTEAMLAKIIPALATEKNKKSNLEELAIRQKLVALGKDPNLASLIASDTDEFRARLDIKNNETLSALVEVEVDRIAFNAATQAEMNAIAFDRYVAADRLMTIRYERLISAPELSDHARESLIESQRTWEKLRELDALAEGVFTSQGGSMTPMVHGFAMEDATIARLAKLDYFTELQFER